MVKPRFVRLALVTIFILITFAGTTTAQRIYHLNQEWVKIWINQDGTIDLFYNLSITLDSGPDINYVLFGQPQRDFTIGPARDQYGNTLTATDVSSGNDYKVRVNLYAPLKASETVWLTLMTNVADMIYEDTQENVGMKFIPQWWSVEIHDLRVLIVLPPNVTLGQVKTLLGVNWNNTRMEDDQLAIFFEKQDLAPDQQYPVGVSFPKEYIENYVRQPSGLIAFLQQYGPALFALGFIAAVVGVIIYVARKKPYLLPRVSMETLGIRRGLTAVEASYLIGMKPTRIVTEILYSLLRKRVLWVESINPALKLKKMPSSQDATESQETPLRYYELDFLDAIKKDGVLDEEKLANTIMFLRETVEQKIRGYCRRDTIDYYKKIVAEAWKQVEQAGTPELASKAYDEQLLWLLLDPNYQTRTQTTFQDKVFEPTPFWLWYWYSYRHYDPKPTYQPNIENPAQSAKPPTIPGADFANNIATAVENTSNNIVVNLEKFANAIIPMPAAKASTEPARQGTSCVCACAACACVCACVSCACACASGGVG